MLANDPVPATVCVVPELNSTVPLFASVPVLLQLPLTVKVNVADMVRVAPVLIVIFRQTAPEAPIVGENAAPDEIVTSVEASGIKPLHQLAAVNQSLLVPPSQVPLLHDAVATVNIPVPFAKNVGFTKSTPTAPVPPYLPEGCPV